MSQIISEIKKQTIFNCQGKYSRKFVDYNHVTILFYFIQPSKNTAVTLRPHCDLQVSPSNKTVKGNSQKENTPTIVLTLQCSKYIDFYKRYSNGKKFESSSSTKVSSMLLNHGDFFVLHPEDERVLNRRILCSDKKIENTSSFEIESKLSQFQHGVQFSSNNDINVNDKNALVSISVCFRETTTKSRFCLYRHIEVVPSNSKHDDQCKPKSKITDTRSILFSKLKVDINHPKNIKRIRKKLNKFHNISILY